MFVQPRRISWLGALSVLALIAVPAAGQVQVTVFNPNWNMTLTDAGYSDLLLDNTPGFEGREYLSGEWGAAVGYKRGATTVAPTWLEPQFIFPDWTTNSNFTTVTPITVTGQSFGGMDAMASSTIANPDLRIDLSYEMIDTVTGMPIGKSPASAGSASSIDSNRYVLKQTYTVTNTSGATVSDLNLFQFLHALQGVESLYDNRNYTGPLSNYRYDTTQSAIDPTYSGTGNTFRDYLSFGSRVAPVAFDNGRYGVEGIDNHATGKPSVGVHLAVEGDALANADHFADGVNPLWVGGAQKYTLGTLASGQSAAIDFMLSVRTGTVIGGGGECSGSANGGSSNPGGVDYFFEDVTKPGAFFAEYSEADQEEIDEHVRQGEFTVPDFPRPPGAMPLYEVEFDGEFDGSVTLTFGYDPSLLPSGYDDSQLRVYHFLDDAWQDAGGIVDSLAHTITITTESLSPFALGAVPEPAVGGLMLLLASARLLRRARQH